MKQPIKHIISDLTGVILYASRLKQLQWVGIMNSIAYTIRYQKNPVSRFFQMLEALYELETEAYPIIYYKNTPLPKYVSDLMLGTINNEEAGTILQSKLQHLMEKNFFYSLQDLRIMQKIAYMSSSPRFTIATLSPDNQMVNLLHTIKNSTNCQLYLLSNFDTEGYAILETLYPEIFALFDKKIISAHVQLLKPYPEIYTYVLKSYNIEPATALFIDDQLENIQGAQDVGINAIQYNTMARLNEELKQYKLQ